MEIITPQRHPTEAALRTRLSVPQIAQTLGITTNYCYQILRGDVLPSLDLEQKLEKLKDQIMSENEKPNWPSEELKQEFQGDWECYKAYLGALDRGVVRIAGSNREGGR